MFLGKQPSNWEWSANRHPTAGVSSNTGTMNQHLVSQYSGMESEQYNQNQSLSSRKLPDPEATHRALLERSRAKLVAECLIDDYGIAFDEYQRTAHKGRSFQEIFDAVILNSNVAREWKFASRVPQLSLRAIASVPSIYEGFGFDKRQLGSSLDNLLHRIAAVAIDLKMTTGKQDKVDHSVRNILFNHGLLDRHSNTVVSGESVVSGFFHNDVPAVEGTSAFTRLRL